jgi:CubicO group peptidase (beta-lactamase class C family)
MKKGILCVLLTVSCTLLFAQPKILTVSAPEKASMSAERLQRIDRLIRQYMDSNWIEGAIAIVVKDGNIVYHKAVGYDDRSKNKLLQKDAIFRIASQTKAITSVAVMMLFEEGKFLLDDAVSKYIPEFRKPKVLDTYNANDTTYTTIPAKREITIRDLLTHTSGVGYAQIGSQQMNAIYYKAGVVGGIGLPAGSLLADNMKKLATLPLFHQPGEKWTYGLNTDLLGYLVEVVSGMSLDAYFRKHIFEPLGMKDTYFYLPEEKKQRLALLHADDADKHVIISPELVSLNGRFLRDFPVLPGGSFYSGGGGLVSTAYDYAVFMQMLLNGGEYNGKRILSPNTVRLMTVNQIADTNMGRSAKFGLGFQIVTEGDEGRNIPPVGTYAWGGMFASSYWIDPKNKIVAQFVLQHFPYSHGDIAEKFKAAVYQALR